ncbi:hypothetical protein B0H14DRAFT_3151445 [Mycena olivaceomarginata]|nr:hypothetical protein B0H14DRAFT_3151445 [Mycena olivaceomarginata]
MPSFSRSPSRGRLYCGPYWDMGQNGPFLRLHNVLEASPHLIRYVRELSLRHTDGYSTDLATFRKVSNFPFIHLESFSIEISERQQLSDGYSSGLRRLFGLPTLVYLKLDIVIHEFSAFLEIWGGFSPSIRHVELTARLSFEDEPELDNPVVTPNPIQLDSLQVTLSHSNPLSDHFGMYRWALGPFDLSHLRALSIRDDAGVPWERFASQTIQLLDVDAREEESPINLSLFPNLLLLRITPVNSIPSMLLETLSTVASFHRLQSIMIDTCYGYVPFSLDWDETECAPLDSALSALCATVEFEVIFGSEIHEDANKLFPELTSRNMLRFVERRQAEDCRLVEVPVPFQTEKEQRIVVDFEHMSFISSHSCPYANENIGEIPAAPHQADIKMLPGRDVKFLEFSAHISTRSQIASPNPLGQSSAHCFGTFGCLRFYKECRVLFFDGYIILCAFSSCFGFTRFARSTRRFFPRDNAALSQDQNATGSIGEQANRFTRYQFNWEETTTLVNLDTGSSDLWVVSSGLCSKMHAPNRKAPPTFLQPPSKNPAANVINAFMATPRREPSPPAQYPSLLPLNDSVNNAIPDSRPVWRAGILGLGFPTESILGLSPAINNRHLGHWGSYPSGNCPDGIDNSSLTWVPVRLYSPAEGGTTPPTFAPNEVMLRISSSACVPVTLDEIDLEGVYLDGVEVPASTIPSSGGVDATRMSALIDTGNSILRGPSDVVSNILGTISPNNYSPDYPNSAILACAKAHNLAFKIGGQPLKMFPIDPRDLLSPVSTVDASTCMINKLVATDAPVIGGLFRWNLGDPFMKSNLVAFYFGNLTHPSQDPPRIGFLSQVPSNAAELLAQATEDATENGGHFESIPAVIPDAELEPQVTVVPSSASLQAAKLTATISAAPTPTPSSVVLSGSNRNSNHSNAARSLGVWNPWLIAIGTITLAY